MVILGIAGVRGGRRERGKGENRGRERGGGGEGERRGRGGRGKERGRGGRGEGRKGKKGGGEEGGRRGREKGEGKGRRERGREREGDGEGERRRGRKGERGEGEKEREERRRKEGEERGRERSGLFTLYKCTVPIPPVVTESFILKKLGNTTPSQVGSSTMRTLKLPDGSTLTSSTTSPCSSCRSSPPSITMHSITTYLVPGSACEWSEQNYASHN